MKNQFVVAVLFLIFPQAALCQTFVAGHAVYRDADSNQMRLAPGVDLILVAGSYRGPRSAPPPSSVLDTDTTSSRLNRYRPEDEGIFQLYTSSSLTAVSIFYRRPLPEDSEPGQPEFFSKAVTPRTKPHRNRLVAKLRLELWPTNLAVTDARTMERIAAGIIETHVTLGRLEDKPEEVTKRAIELELENLADLLPEDADKRQAMVRRTLERLPTILPRRDFDAKRAVEWVRSFGERLWRPTGRHLKSERDRWERVRVRFK